MKINYNFLSYSNNSVDILWVSLNPTQQAINDGAIFSNSNGLWNIYRKAELIYEESKNIKPIKMQELIYIKKQMTDYNMEHVDLLPHIIETDSSLVKPTVSDVKLLIDEIKDNPPTAIALMGQKLVDIFHQTFPNQLKSWKAMESVFGLMGEIEINGKKVAVFKLPFPVNNSIPKKYKHYRIVKDFIDTNKN